jgi:hypothetical protein
MGHLVQPQCSPTAETSTPPGPNTATGASRSDQKAQTPIYATDTPRCKPNQSSIEGYPEAVPQPGYTTRELVAPGARAPLCVT